MTCIVFWLGKDSLYTGSDSSCLSEYRKVDEGSPKVFKNGSFVCGCAGNFKQIQSFQFAFKFPAIGKLSPMKYMVQKFLPALKELYQDEDEDKLLFEYIIAFNGKLFTINSLYEITEHKKHFGSVGNGDSFALGALYGTKNSYTCTVEKKLTIALQAASEYCADVYEPFIINEYPNEGHGEKD